jgi:hypothetical protein
MPGLIQLMAGQWSALRDWLFVGRAVAGRCFGPLLIDRGLVYDVERDVTWLQDNKASLLTIAGIPAGGASMSENNVRLGKAAPHAAHV